MAEQKDSLEQTNIQSFPVILISLKNTGVIDFSTYFFTLFAQAISGLNRVTGTAAHSWNGTLDFILNLNTFILL